MQNELPLQFSNWPGHPEVHGWLRLSRRGDWFVKGQKVTHPRSLSFINAHYQSDPQGRWFFQNGRQRVFVQLAYTPYILRLNGTDSFKTHTGLTINELKQVCLDDEGNLLFQTEFGIALLNDYDLPLVQDYLATASGTTPDDSTLMIAIDLLLQGCTSSLFFMWKGSALPIKPIQVNQVSKVFHFQKEPKMTDQEPGIHIN